MFIDKKITVYYRDIPSILETHLSKDDQIRFVKDGLKIIDGHKCPRLTIIISATEDHEADKNRLKKLETLLEELLRNNQIVSY